MEYLYGGKVIRLDFMWGASDWNSISHYLLGGRYEEVPEGYYRVHPAVYLHAYDISPENLIFFIEDPYRCYLPVEGMLFYCLIKEGYWGDTYNLKGRHHENHLQTPIYNNRFYPVSAL
jgi:hypothetical protein